MATLSGYSTLCLGNFTDARSCLWLWHYLSGLVCVMFMNVIVDVVYSDVGNVVGWRLLKVGRMKFFEIATTMTVNEVVK